MNDTDTPSSSVIIILTTLKTISTQILLVLLSFGIFPNIINCLIFYQKRFRKNACSLLCGLVSTINILILIQGFIRTLLTILWESDAENYNLIYCRTRLYIRHSLMMINRTYTIFACVACYALSSKRVNLRSLINRISLTYYSIFLMFCFWFIVSLHISFNMNIINNQCQMNEIYEWIFSIYLILLAGIISPNLMIFFIFRTLKNLKEIHRPRQVTNQNIARLIKRDSQLIRMLLLHVLVYILTTSLYPMNIIYGAVTQHINKSSERIAIENFISFYTNHLIFYLNNISPFFVYFTISSNFRAELKKLWVICRNSNRISVFYHEAIITHHTTDQTNTRRQPTIAVVS